MSEFVNFQRCLIELGDQQIYATSAQLTVSTSLDRDVRFDGFSQTRAGATVNDPTFVPSGPLSGSLNFEFIIAEQHFNPIKSIFDISSDMSEELIPLGRIGNYRFWNASLSSFSFSMEPFQLVKAKAEYEIFGTIHEIGDKRLPQIPDINPAESLKSYGEITASGIDLQDENNKFDMRMLSAEYTANATRKNTYTIRMNEHPSSNFASGGVLPYRSAITDISINCNVRANKIINYINHKGVIQKRHPSELPENISIQLNLFGAKKENVHTLLSAPDDHEQKIDENTYNNLTAANKSLYSEANRESMHIASFACIGKVMNQALDVSSGGYLSGGFQVSQVIR